MTRGSRALAVVSAGVLLLVAGCRPQPTAQDAQPSSSSAATSRPATATGDPPAELPSASSTTATSASATAAATPALDPRVASALARLDQRGRVAQLFVVGVPLDHLAAADPLLAQGVGGVFLAGRSTAGAADLASITAGWTAPDPRLRPWVALDQEGGQVQTLTGPGFPALPSAVEQGGLPPDQLAGLADGTGAALAAAGINLDLAPVADVVPAGTEAANPPIGAFDRQYGSTPAQVQAAAGAMVDGLAAHGVTATLKHFPGLGRVQANTDTAASVVDDATGAEDPQVDVFGELGRRPAHPFVMVSSAVYSRIDPGAPAAFSPAVVTDLLRHRLGYDGVAISDDLANATAVTGVAPGDRAVRFLAAGGTLVLLADAGDLPAMIDAVLARSAADPAFAARVDDAVRVALAAKARAGLLTG